MLTIKVRGYWNYTCEYKGALCSICNLKYSISKKISVKFHNGSNYNQHFIVKDLVEESERQFACLEENTEKEHNLFNKKNNLWE